MSDTTQRGSYVALRRSDGIQVAADAFTIRETRHGVVVESQYVGFGQEGRAGIARFELDGAWAPCHVIAEVGGAQAFEARFSEASADLSLRSGAEESRVSIPVARQEALVLLAGALHFPLHVVRRLNPNEGVRTFALIPEGSCEVVRLAGENDGGRSVQVYDLRISIGSIYDLARVVVDPETRRVLRYWARGQDLVVRLDES